MHYDQINRTTDYASIAHGMPEYRILSFGEIDHGIALAKREQSRMIGQSIAKAVRAIRGLFSGGRSQTA